MTLKKIALLSFVSVLAFGGPAFAQAVESVPLAAPDYTLKGESDPMAMDPGSVTPTEKVINRGEAQPATPPPGMNDQPGASSDQAVGGYDATPSPTQPPADFSPSGDSMSETQPVPAMDGERTGSYPNNTVSGVVKTDEKKFENRTFCTLKVTFSSVGAGINAKLADRVKTYLDSNTEKLTYKKAVFGKKGEFEYCLDIPTHNNRARIYTDLKKLLPIRETGDKRTYLTGKGFNRVENSY
jgi:hypothetical protein